MISLQKNFLFVHIPKTGGNSIQNILKNYSENQIVKLGKHQDGIERFGLRDERYKLKKHSTLSAYKKTLEPKIYKSLFKFATIRNPWDRMISFYFSPGRGVREWNRELFLELVHKVKPLRHYITEPSWAGKVIRKFDLPLDIGKKRLDSNMDFLIKFENLEEDFKLLCGKLDILHSPLPKYNQSERQHYSYYYDRELREIVRTKFSEEIDYGNYEF